MDTSGDATASAATAAPRCRRRWAWWPALLVLLGLLAAFVASAQAPAPTSTGTLRYANRDIVTFHAIVAGATPPERADRAVDALDRLGDAGRAEPISLQPFQLEGHPALAVLVGHQLVFAVTQGDVGRGGSLNGEGEQVQRRLAQALESLRLQRQPRVLLRGIAITLGSGIVVLLLLWALSRGMGWLEARLTQATQRVPAGRHMRWQEYAWPIVRRLLSLARWAAYLFVGFAWLVLVLQAFPLTYPLARATENFVSESLRHFGRAAVAATPGLVTVLLILFVTRAISEGVALLLNNVQAGRIRLPFVYRDTAAATKRLVNIAIWGIGAALAYPYLPGADSQVFRGISVIFGLVLTLGSSGIVNQLMSGLVIIYSRALRCGDWVEINGVEAEVVEVGGLATKLMNYNRHEIIIPNSVLTGSSVRNYTRRAETDPIFLSVKVTIGYDAPWRLVHQMLLDAAAATTDLVDAPAPFVLQRALNDFYVEYEVFAALRDPMTTLRRKPEILSAFNANVQDAFNREGVQILSPHYVLQPRHAVVVPPDQWFTQVRGGE